ncbi:hypothetical protein [Aequorivita lipolytica]|uniref:Uncharacterized protein n=1 Tax=Aequorivita lipolytica TaxID=153267 RepID=A0A5C6YSL8_9FLAO|nr:hypothetical protein [Aequorivita lipolytica]TXD69958.1 hypothetical protein ESV24_05870 [Aequorivita lipolytica]SRX50217.1 hypothetical protein AEQU2_00686 [Aequorivita lipolytica]
MTTITIKKGILQKTHFEGFSEFLQYMAKQDGDFSSPDFKDTVITDEILKRAEAIRKEFLEKPEKFKRAIQ